MRTLLSTIILFFVCCTMAIAANTTIPNPKIGGYALDICRSWAKDCGKPAADAYCKYKGYKQSVSHVHKKNAPPTKVFHGGGLCVESYCGRISQVTCEPKTVTFNNPKIGGYALDICRSWAKDCGKPAADAYCKYKGYKQSVSHVHRKNAPPTKVFHGGGLCVENYCGRISSVVCK